MNSFIESSSALVTEAHNSNGLNLFFLIPVFFFSLKMFYVPGDSITKSDNCCSLFVINLLREKSNACAG